LNGYNSGTRLARLVRRNIDRAQLRRFISCDLRNTGCVNAIRFLRPINYFVLPRADLRWDAAAPLRMVRRKR
jgi:hypothetical protein